MRARLTAFAERPWVSFVVQLYKRFDASRLPLLAAALAYYAAFSLGPLLLLLAGWLGVFIRSRPELLDQYSAALADLVSQLLPLRDDADALVQQSFNVILDQLGQGALLRTIVSFLILVWASTNFFTSLQLALEVIFDVPQVRGFWRKRAVAVLLVATVALVIGVELIGGLLASSINEFSQAVATGLREVNFDVPDYRIRWGSNWWTELIRFGVATLVFTVCFRYLPRRSSSWLGALIGALFSTASIIVTRYIFTHLFNLERFNLIYGVVTSLLAVLLWLYFALLMFLVGALIVAEISARVRPDQLETTDKVAPDKVESVTPTAQEVLKEQG